MDPSATGPQDPFLCRSGPERIEPHQTDQDSPAPGPVAKQSGLLLQVLR